MEGESKIKWRVIAKTTSPFMPPWISVYYSAMYLHQCLQIHNDYDYDYDNYWADSKTDYAQVAT